MERKNWNDLDLEGKVNYLREKFDALIDFVDEHEHGEHGNVHVKNSIYSTGAVGGHI